MAIGVLVLGKSGSGKTCSLRNFTNDDPISVINVNGKPLPFKNDLKRVVMTDNPGEIIKAIQKTASKIIVIDDSQYIMANMYMKNANVPGFQKFEVIGSSFWRLVESLKQMPADKIVYFLHHEETDEFGNIKAKTQGKMIDSHICLEGMFSIVIRATPIEGHYYFSTRNSGNDTVKTPMGMFNDALIDNDLKFVDQTIREYYSLTKPEKQAK